MGSNKLQPIYAANLDNATSMSQRIDPRTGALEQRASYNNGVLRTKITTTSGGSIDTMIRAPKTNNRAERNEAIRQLREKGVKQQDLADAFGLTQPSISNILRKESL